MKRNQKAARASVLLIISLLIPSQLATAQSPNLLQNVIRTSFAHEQLTIAASALGFTSATFNPVVTDAQSVSQRANLAIFSCEASQVRYWNDGGTPTATVGMLVNPGDVIYVFGFNNIKNFLMIRVTATSATCNVQYYRFSANAT
ncbi:MAG TPA: hypothetical protein VNX68_04780 [Nitrosopumilaceae archaeon]|jgi:hypothetical protein|nr:hypothetical protein [Nitrosopumilaceae archaeon]